MSMCRVVLTSFLEQGQVQHMSMLTPWAGEAGPSQSSLPPSPPCNASCTKAFLTRAPLHLAACPSTACALSTPATPSVACPTSRALPLREAGCVERTGNIRKPLALLRPCQRQPRRFTLHVSFEKWHRSCRRSEDKWGKTGSWFLPAAQN